MTARATEITDALLDRLATVPGLSVSYGPPRDAAATGRLYLIAETDAQGRDDGGRNLSARVRDREYRIEVYLPRGPRYYAVQDDALQAICVALAEPTQRPLGGLASSLIVGDVSIDDPQLGSACATLRIPLTVRRADPPA